jgi:hypothetical protein
MKIIIFDLDETIGFFGEIYTFFCAVKHYFSVYSNTEYKDEDVIGYLIDIFPELLRPGILNILRKLSHDKIYNPSPFYVYIYTSNKLHDSWANNIKNYLNNKTRYNILDDVIFNTTPKQRTVIHNKNIDNFSKQSNISLNNDFCFIDNNYHPYMIKPNIHYIHLNNYICYISVNQLIQRTLVSTTIGKYISYKTIFIKEIKTYYKNLFSKRVLNYLNSDRRKPKDEISLDKRISIGLYENIISFLHSK